jgi:hypothetical protein
MTSEMRRPVVLTFANNGFELWILDGPLPKRNIMIHRRPVRSPRATCARTCACACACFFSPSGISVVGWGCAVVRRDPFPETGSERGDEVGEVRWGGGLLEREEAISHDAGDDLTLIS